MSFTLTLNDALGERNFSREEFPLSLGGTGSTIVLAGGFNGPAAWCGLHEESLFLQPAEGVELNYNGAAARSSVWLKPGDVVTLGAARLRLESRDGRAVLNVEDGSVGNITAPPVIEVGQRVSGGTDTDEERIEAIHFRSTGAATAKGRSFNPRRVIVPVLAVLFAVAIWFVFTSVSLTVTVATGADRIALKGGLPALGLGSQYLLRPGQYELQVERAGYKPLTQTVEVTEAANQRVDVTLEKLPGLVSIEASVAATVSIDGVEVGSAPGVFEVAPGKRAVSLSAPRYRPFSAELDVEGAGVKQSLNAELVPAWAKVNVISQPAGAELFVSGERRGITPLETEIEEGSRPIELRLKGFTPWATDLNVVANQPQTVGPVRLGLPDGRLVIRSNPAGASVTVGGAYRGQTPLELPVRPDLSQALVLAKPGYEPTERSVTVGPGARQVIDLELTGIYGELTVAAQPADAQLFVDGVSRGAANQKLRLTATTHDIEIRKPGLVTHKVSVTPRPGLSQAVNVTLLTAEEAKVAAIPAVINSKAGELRLMPAGKFVMGSSRREPGRRANEAQREVELKRRFYLGTREVTNADYRQFRTDHRSGFVAAHSLDLDRQPAVNVGWQQAAAFCNWLSEQEGLPAAYETKNGALVPIVPATTGYRLPTEAEWEWAARYERGTATRRYPWGEALPVAARSGNYADYSARIIIQDVIPDYDDGYPASAPVGSFPPNALGLFDMGGNVAEWTQDLYTVTADASQVAVDPLSNGEAGQRVIRGSSWRQSGVTDLRLTARDFGAATRTDLGFRLARYAE
ncbi:MAG: PEGA domain-containing protein [Steroidobacteraceae bacterium]